MRPLGIVGKAVERALIILPVVLLASCGSDSDAALADAGGIDAQEKSAGCASLCEGDAAPPEGTICFGSELTNGFGRLDGTILASVGPTDSTCDLPNSDHLVLQVLLNGAAYRMVANVESDGRNGTDTALRFLAKDAALPAPAWEAGWHTGVALDYPTQLSAHTGDFEILDMAPLVDRVESLLEIGAPVSVYATSENRPNAAHLVHRNGSNNDGAIVVNPTSATPTFLLFHFDGQVF